MALRERITSLLQSQPGRELCAACIARELDVKHKSAHQAALKLEASRGFRRQYGRCATCGKTRLVATAVPGFNPSEADTEALTE